MNDPTQQDHLASLAGIPAQADRRRRVIRSTSTSRDDSEPSSASHSPTPGGPSVPARPGQNTQNQLGHGKLKTDREDRRGDRTHSGTDDLGGSNKRGRRKVAKACLACQKSHLTCDDRRPCARCVRKGLGDQCIEGTRKKAKYLLEGDERGHRASGSHTLGSLSPGVTLLPPPLSAQVPDPLLTRPGTDVDHDMWLSASLDNGMPQLVEDEDNSRFWTGRDDVLGQDVSYPFGPTAASTEYQMLDSMFGAMDPVFPLLSTDDPLDFLDPMTSNLISPSWPTSVQEPIMTNDPHIPVQSQRLQPMNRPVGSIPPMNHTLSGDNDAHDLQNAWTSWDLVGKQAAEPVPFLVAPASASQGLGGVGVLDTETSYKARKALTPSEVYRNVIKPYDYMEGYHFLMDYLQKKRVLHRGLWIALIPDSFEQRDVLRVVRALAAYRPSLIALQMPLSEEDEIFLERSFQRTLIELEKLISYSATPTAVWRRTGEVCYANPEFCKMVDRTDLELTGRRTYVYQSLAKTSVVAYWENFSVHAFENTTQNYFMPTTLIASGGEEIKCSCCFTIRRDVFDLPSVVIGQFLPIPPDFAG